MKANAISTMWRSMAAVLVEALPAWGNSALVVSSVTASQRNDGSKKVSIRYNLTDADGDACTVTVQVSNNVGAT